MLSLKVSTVVPLDYSIFQLTDPAHVTVNLLRLVLRSAHTDVFVVGKHGVGGWSGDVTVYPSY